MKMYLRFSIFVCVTLLVVGLYVRSKQPNTTISSLAKFDDTAHDFGAIPDDAIVTHAFCFKNITNHTIAISGVSTGCGCTLAFISKKILLANEMGTVKVSFNPNHLHGEQNKKISVTFFEEDHPILLSLRACVHPVVSCEPSTVFITDAKSNNKQQVLCLTNNSDKRVQLKYMTSGIPDLRISLPASGVILPHQVVKATVELNVPRAGDYTGSIHIMIDTPGPYAIDVPVSGSIKSKWLLNTDEFYIGFIPRNKHLTCTVTIKHLAISDIEKIWTDVGQAGKVSDQSADGGNSTMIALRLNSNKLPKEEIHSSVYVCPKRSLGPIIRIPVVGKLEENYDCHCHH